jgi:hypothetical protein
MPYRGKGVRTMNAKLVPAVGHEGHDRKTCAICYKNSRPRNRAGWITVYVFLSVLFGPILVGAVLHGLGVNLDYNQSEKAAPAAVERTPTASEILRNVGEVALSQGLATTYDVSVWDHALDLHISSLLPGDARFVSEGFCGAVRNSGNPILHGWQIRVFILTSDNTPAAVCRL